MAGTHLSELPLWSAEEAREHENGATIRGMVGSGLACCGFVIFRCVYDEDYNDDYAAYLEALKDTSHKFEKRYGNQDGSFEKYVAPAVAWTIIEDEANLKDVTKDTVRERFLVWRDEQLKDTNLSARISLSQAYVYNDLPRFNYCLAIDKACIDTYRAYQQFLVEFKKKKAEEKALAEEDGWSGSELDEYDRKPWPNEGPPVTIALIAGPWSRPFGDGGPYKDKCEWFGWGDYFSRKDPPDEDEEDGGDEDGQDEGDNEEDKPVFDEEESDEYSDEEDLSNVHEPIEGCTRFEVGWMNLEIKHVLGMYSTLHHHDIWYYRYLRPPLVYPKDQFRSSRRRT